MLIVAPMLLVLVLGLAFYRTTIWWAPAVLLCGLGCWKLASVEVPPPARGLFLGFADMGVDIGAALLAAGFLWYAAMAFGRRWIRRPRRTVTLR